MKSEGPSWLDIDYHVEFRSHKSWKSSGETKNWYEKKNERNMMSKGIIGNYVYKL